MAGAHGYQVGKYVSMNTKEFKQDMDAFKQIMWRDVNTVTKALTQELFRLVVRDTPVDTGRTQSNWIFSCGKIPVVAHRSEGFGYDKSKRGGAVVSLINGQINRAPNLISESMIENQKVTDPGKAYWLTNSVPYSYGLEYGIPDEHNSYGFSPKAPSGMMRKNVRKYAGRNIMFMKRK